MGIGAAVGDWRHLSHDAGMAAPWMCRYQDV